MDAKAQERLNVANHKWTILRNGKLLPVVNLFGIDGQPVANPMHAFRVVVYEDEQWLVYPCQPGELWSRHDRTDRAAQSQSN